jgi:hypothetical protein
MQVAAIFFSAFFKNSGRMNVFLRLKFLAKAGKLGGLSVALPSALGFQLHHFPLNLQFLHFHD